MLCFPLDVSKRSIEDDNGRTIYITEVVCDSVAFLESKGDNGNYPQTDEQIDETYKDNPYNPTITTPTDRRNERKGKTNNDESGLPF